MTTTSHTNCPHPATKAARAKCRKESAARVDALQVEAGELIFSYYNGEGDFDTIISRLMEIFPEVRTAYFDTDADPDELIALAHTLKITR